jgi:hypothetical protein
MWSRPCFLMVAVPPCEPIFFARFELSVFEVIAICSIYYRPFMTIACGVMRAQCERVENSSGTLK